MSIEKPGHSTFMWAFHQNMNILRDHRHQHDQFYHLNRSHHQNCHHSKSPIITSSKLHQSTPSTLSSVIIIISGIHYSFNIKLWYLIFNIHPVNIFSKGIHFHSIFVAANVLRTPFFLPLLGICTGNQGIPSIAN